LEVGSHIKIDKRMNADGINVSEKMYKLGLRWIVVSFVKDFWLRSRVKELSETFGLYPLCV